MTISEIINSLKDQARDKEALANGDADSIFAHDAEELLEAAELLQISALLAQQRAVKLNRNCWERCDICEYDCVVGLVFSQYKYCPNCGRPLTEEAWTELERER